MTNTLDHIRTVYPHAMIIKNTMEYPAGSLAAKLKYAVVDAETYILPATVNNDMPVEIKHITPLGVSCLLSGWYETQHQALHNAAMRLEAIIASRLED